MSRAGVLNTLAVLGALAASMLLAARPIVAPSGASHASSARRSRGYHRIVSASTVADRLLVELCEPDRVLAFTTASATGPDAHRYAGHPHIDRIDDAEALTALRPDVVVVHNVADARRVERLRSAGLRVIDLGPLQGLGSLAHDARVVASLCGAPERAGPYVRSIERRLRAVARHLPPHERRGAVYLTIYTGQLFGGTRGSSYHEVLTYAGLRDEAAARYSGWPQYSEEQVLAMNPELIVTRRGMRRPLCARLPELRACRERGIVELDGALLDAPGPGVLDATEALHASVYGE